MNNAIIKGLIAEIKECRQQESELLEKLAANVCPYKVGQQTTVKGYSFRGKPCRITRIRADLSERRDFFWNVWAVVIRKDGTEGRTTDWSDWNESNG